MRVSLMRAIIVMASISATLAVGQVALRTLTGHMSGVASLAFSPDGKTLATCGNDDAARTWDAQTGALKITLKEKAAAVAFYPDGKRFALGTRDADTKAGLVKIVDAATGEVKLLLPGHAATVQGVAISADGKLLASTAQDRTVKIWDAQTGDLRVNIESVRGTGSKVAVSADGQLVAADTRDGARIWDVQSGQMKRDFEHASANCLAISPDGKQLATGSGGVIGGLLQGEVKLWDVETGEVRRTVKNLTTSLAFSPDGKFLAAGGSGDTFGDVKVWEVQSGDLRTTLFSHGSWVVSLVFSSDGKTIASGSLDKTVKLWDVSGLK